MDTKWRLTFVFGLSLGIAGCGSSTPGTSSSGGSGPLAWQFISQF